MKAETLAALAALLAIPLGGRLYQALGSRRDRRRYPPPGRLLETPAGCFHVRVTGQGRPVVVLEAGIAATSLSWTRIQEQLSSRATVVSYDRAGLGWSGATRAPRDVGRLAEELHTVLEALDLPGPYVLAGHSFGGYLVRHFAARYPHLVAALVLLDPLDPGEWCPLSADSRYRLSRGVLLSRWGAALARWGLVRFALELLIGGSRTIPKLIARGVSTGRGASFLERLVGEVRKLPEEVWPMVKALWCQPKSFLAMADYLESLPRNCAARPDDNALRNVPLWLLSADSLPPERLAGHRAIAALSTRGVHQVAPQAGHWVHLDQPALVLSLFHQSLKSGD